MSSGGRSRLRASLLCAALGLSSCSTVPPDTPTPRASIEPSAAEAQTAPPACLDAKLVWADALDRLLLVNCFDHLEGRGWVRYLGLSPGPSARGLPAMALDPERNVIVLYGGFDADSNPLGDTWEWDVEWRCAAGC